MQKSKNIPLDQIPLSNSGSLQPEMESLKKEMYHEKEIGGSLDTGNVRSPCRDKKITERKYNSGKLSPELNHCQFSSRNFHFCSCIWIRLKHRKEPCLRLPFI